MWTSYLDSHSVLGVPLLVILLCGLLGVLVDLDHPISYYWLRSLKARFLHTPLLLVSCGILGVTLARVAGLLLGVVLR